MRVINLVLDERRWTRARPIDGVRASVRNHSPTGKRIVCSSAVERTRKKWETI